MTYYISATRAYGFDDVTEIPSTNTAEVQLQGDTKASLTEEQRNLIMRTEQEKRIKLLENLPGLSIRVPSGISDEDKLNLQETLLFTTLNEQNNRMMRIEQEARIKLLENLSGLSIRITSGISDEDKLNLQEDLLFATLNEQEVTLIYLDSSGRRCNNCLLGKYCIMFDSSQKKFSFVSPTDPNGNGKQKITANDLPTKFSFTDESNNQCFIEVVDTHPNIDESNNQRFIEVVDTHPKKNQIQLIFLGFSDAVNKIKNLFASIVTRISSSIETFQIARQQERVIQLESQSDFFFEGENRNQEQDQLDQTAPPKGDPIIIEDRVMEEKQPVINEVHRTPKNDNFLQTALLKVRKTSLLSEIFYINSNGHCEKNNATAWIFYDYNTKNFTVNPIKDETTDLKLNNHPIEGGQHIPFQDGDNIFTSDTNLLGFKVHIPLVDTRIEKPIFSINEQQ